MHSFPGSREARLLHIVRRRFRGREPRSGRIRCLVGRVGCGPASFRSPRRASSWRWRQLPPRAGASPPRAPGPPRSPDPSSPRPSFCCRLPTRKPSAMRHLRAPEVAPTLPAPRLSVLRRGAGEEEQPRLKLRAAFPEAQTTSKARTPASVVFLFASHEGGCLVLWDSSAWRATDASGTSPSAVLAVEGAFFFSRQGLTIYPWLDWNSRYKPSWLQIYRGLLPRPPNVGIKYICPRAQLRQKPIKKQS